MIRLLALAVYLHSFAWNAGTHPSGSFMVWAGTLVTFDCGPHVALEWDEDGVSWSAMWCDRQNLADDFEAWSRYAEGRFGCETKIVTP